jgi:hypothetical protein
MASPVEDVDTGKGETSITTRMHSAEQDTRSINDASDSPGNTQGTSECQNCSIQKLRHSANKGKYPTPKNGDKS